MAMQTDIQPGTPRNRGDYDAAHLSPITPAEDVRTIMLNRISWGAVLGGVVMALAVHLILNLVGIGIGAASVPNVSDNGTVENLSFGAMVWWTVAGICAALAGGFTAGRLAGEPKESTAGWHGLTAWATSVLVVAVLMTTAAGALFGNSQVMADLTGNRSQISANGGVNNNGVGTEGYVAGQSYNGVTGTTNDVTGATGDTTTIGNTTVDTETAADALAGSAIFSAIALILGAIAAWFGGRAGAIDPTITDRTLRSEEPLH